MKKNFCKCGCGMLAKPGNIYIHHHYSKTEEHKKRAREQMSGHWRLAMGKDIATEKDKLWAIEEAKNLLLCIDRFHKISVKKADWS